MQKMLIPMMAIVCIACIPAQDRTAYLLEHGWGVQNIDLVPLPEQPITFRPVPELSDSQELIKTRFEFNNSFRVYAAERQTMFPIHDSDYLISYEFRDNGRALALVLLSDGIGLGYHLRPDNYVNSDEATLIGPWIRSSTREPSNYYVLINEQSSWQLALTIPQGHPEHWPTGTHLARWIDENTLETDDTFGNRMVFEVIEEHRMMRDDQFWLRMISPIENPTNEFEGDLILRPVLHPDQWSEGMRDFP